MDERLLHVLRQRPCALLTDIDGTISPIAPTPDAAFVVPAAREQLAALAERLDLIAAISGRAAADAAQMVGLPQLLYIGNHGLETWRNGVAEPIGAAVPYAAAIDDVLHQARQQVNIPGVLWENKGVTASVHYRLAPDPPAAQAAIGAVLQDLIQAHGLRLTGGRMVWEIRPPLPVDKGAAVRRLVAAHGLRGVVFLGDDRTDADAFAVLHELRAAGTCATLAVGVLSADTPAVVRDRADLLVDGVDGVVALLEQIAAALRAHR